MICIRYNDIDAGICRYECLIKNLDDVTCSNADF